MCCARKQETVKLNETLSLTAIDALLNSGLKYSGAEEAVIEFRKLLADARAASIKAETDGHDAMEADISSQATSLREGIKHFFDGLLHERFP